MDDAAMDPDREMSSDEEEDEGYDSRQLGYNPQVENGGYDPQLANVRMESVRKIRGRFEHIYQKYGKDFDGVGDEIDMATGVIVVNNGHLQNMEHEVDAGNGDALALSRTFEDEGDDDDDDEGSSDSDVDLRALPTGDDDGNSVSSASPDLDFSWQEDTVASLTSVEDRDSSVNRMPKPAQRPSTPSNGMSRRKGKERSTDLPTSDPSSRENTASEDIFDGLKDSMLALQDKYKSGQGLGSDDIEALGMSIANQLASFIKGSKASKKRKRQTLPARVESAEGSRGRRLHRNSAPVDPVAPTPARSPGSKSLWAPLVQPKGQRKPKRRKSAEPAAEEADDAELADSMVLQTIMHQSALEPDELQGPTTVRCCSHCKTTETLSWRRGPKAVDLCNNCGMYYYRYGLMRPLHETPPKRKSPTPEEEEEVEVDPRRKSAPYAANTSRPMDGINLFGLHFSAREDAQIIKLKEIDRLTWDAIAMQHPGRTPYALQCRYSKVLAGKPCEARDILSSRGYQFYVDANGHTVARQLGNFTDEEDDLLLKLREEDALDWDEIALELPGRTSEDLEDRYDELARELLGEDQGEAPKAMSKAKSKATTKSGKKRRERSASSRSSMRWTPAEDETILTLREDEKKSWQDVAKQVPGRTLASVQRHYARDIGPYGRSRSSTPRGSPAPGEGPSRLRKYTAEEDETLMRLHADEGLGWEEIAQQMPGRSAQSIQNRYYYKITKDGSLAASRASSVASSSRRDVSVSIPVADLEAQLNGSHEDVLSEEQTFTEAEDSLVVKLRELECLSWEQIAAEMPGRDVSSISCRYYQYLLPRKVPEVREMNHGLDPALQSNVEQLSGLNDAHVQPEIPSTDAEMQQGNSFDASDPAPARKPNAKKRSDGTKRRSTTVRRSDAPMLRRALQTNLNRRSEPKPTSPDGLPYVSMTMDDANESALMENDELAMDHTVPELLPSAFPEDFEQQQPTSSERKLRPSAKRKSMHPETPLRPSRQPHPSSGPTPNDHSFYVTPSRYQAQSNPYFVPNAASPEPEPEPEPQPEPYFPNKKARRARSATEESDNQPEDESEPVRRSSRKRRRAPKTSRARATAPQPTVVDNTDEEEAGLDGDDDDDDNAGEYFTSRKRKTGPSKAEMTFRCSIPGGVQKRKVGDSEAVAARTRVRSPSAAEDETEEEDIDMPDLGTDDDQTSSESEEEEEDDDELRCKPRERSPLFDPRETIEAARHKKERLPHKMTAAAKPGDGNTMQDINHEIDLSTIPPEHRVRPNLTWSQLNFLALKSVAPAPMHTREIYAFLEDRFPFFRLCKGHWRDSIRGNLSTRPEFRKVDPDEKSALWTLTDPDQEAIALPKAGRWARLDENGELKPRKCDLPKKKPGRPSNASKGLPLKRVYKRNYVPAAERKRLAALGIDIGTAAAAGAASVPAAPAGAVTTASIALARRAMSLPGPNRALLAPPPRRAVGPAPFPSDLAMLESIYRHPRLPMARDAPTQNVVSRPTRASTIEETPEIGIDDPPGRASAVDDTPGSRPAGASTIEGSADDSASASQDTAADRPARASTIEDSTGDSSPASPASEDHTAGEPNELVSPLVHEAEIEVKTESQLHEPPFFVAPTAAVLPASDDITREPESSDAAAVPIDIDELASDDATPLSVAKNVGPGLRSSSPAITTAPSSRRLSRTYGKATPGTAKSTLFRQTPVASAVKSFKKRISGGGGSRAGTPSGLRRTVQTPVREVEGSEDELA